MDPQFGLIAIGAGLGAGLVTLGAALGSKL